MEDQRGADVKFRNTWEIGADDMAEGSYWLKFYKGDDVACSYWLFERSEITRDDVAVAYWLNE